MNKFSRLLNYMGVYQKKSSEVETDVSKSEDASQDNDGHKIIDHGSFNKEKEITMKEENSNANSSEKRKATKDKAHIYNLIIVDESGSMSHLREATLSGINPKRSLGFLSAVWQ